MNTMESNIMMILGGYGGAGFDIAYFVLNETQQKVIIAGRNYTKAVTAVEMLNSKFDGHRVQAMRVDATHPEELREAFKRCDTVVVCVPITASGIGGGVVQAAFDAGINYVDINLDESKQKLLRDLGERIKRSGRYFLTEAGFMPGLPSMMALLAAQHLDSLQSLQFGMLERENHGGYGSAIDLMYYAADPAYRYANGGWQKISPMATKKIDFGPGLGKINCYPMDLYELRDLPDKLGVEEVGFYSAGMNPVTDTVLLFWIATGLYKFDWGLKMGAKFGIWTVKQFTRPPYTTTLVLEARGKANLNEAVLKIIISHKNGYKATAIPVVAGILQLLDGTIQEPGVIISGHGVEPNRYVNDLMRMGMDVQIKRQVAGEWTDLTPKTN